MWSALAREAPSKPAPDQTLRGKCDEKADLLLRRNVERARRGQSDERRADSGEHRAGNRQQGHPDHYCDEGLGTDRMEKITGRGNAQFVLTDVTIGRQRSISDLMNAAKFSAPGAGTLMPYFFRRSANSGSFCVARVTS